MQVLGHAKTVLVLLLGWLYLNDSTSMRKLGGMVMAVVGMIGYGYFTSAQQVRAFIGCLIEMHLDRPCFRLKRAVQGTHHSTYL